MFQRGLMPLARPLVLARPSCLFPLHQVSSKHMWRSVQTCSLSPVGEVFFVHSDGSVSCTQQHLSFG